MSNNSHDEEDVQSVNSADVSRPDSIRDDSSTNTGGGSQSMSSKSGSSTTGTSYTGGTGRSTNAIPEAILATKENRAVRFWRIVVLAVIFISAIVAGALTYVLVKESEQQDFEIQVSFETVCCLVFYGSLRLRPSRPCLPSLTF
jgi:hypothetical protein